MPSMLRRVWRLIIGVVGGTVLLIGIALLILPGPGLLVIPLGLAILATEFLWARRLLASVKEKLSRKRPDSKNTSGPGSVP